MNPAEPSQPHPFCERPDELLLQVLLHLQPVRGFTNGDKETGRREENACRVKGLYGLCLTCRKLNDVVTPHLYQSVVQTERNCKTIAKVLRTFQERPDLAEFVEYVEQQLTHEQIRSFQKLDRKAFFSNEDWNMLWKSLGSGEWGPLVDMSIFSKPPVRLSDLWSDEVNLNYPHRVNRAWDSGLRLEVGLEALLAVSKNLLDIALNMPSEETANMLCLRKWPETTKSRRLWQWGNCEWSRVNALFVSPAAYAPPDFVPAAYSFPDYDPEAMHIQNIQEIPVYNCIWPFPHLYDHRVQEEIAFQAPMDEISLQNCNTSPPSLENILSRCRSLKRFTCRWGTSIAPRFSRAQPKIDLETLGTYLREYRDTLQSLTLDTIGCKAHLVKLGLDKITLAIGDLSCFTEMTYLEVSPPVLWGTAGPSEERHLFDMLPGSLEVLVIKMDAEDQNCMVDELYKLVEDEFKVRFPYLKLIDCMVVYEPESDSDIQHAAGGSKNGCACLPVCDERVVWLIDAFGVAGVEMSIRQSDGSECEGCLRRREVSSE